MSAACCTARDRNAHQAQVLSPLQAQPTCIPRIELLACRHQGAPRQLQHGSAQRLWERLAVAQVSVDAHHEGRGALVWQVSFPLLRYRQGGCARVPHASVPLVCASLNARDPPVPASPSTIPFLDSLEQRSPPFSHTNHIHAHRVSQTQSTRHHMNTTYEAPHADEH